MRVVSAETQKEDLRDRVREYTALKLDSLLSCLWGVLGLGFGFCLELRRSSNLVSGILMKGEGRLKPRRSNANYRHRSPIPFLSPRW